MELKGRLRAIADKIPACGTLADIGTDHAYIPIFAIERSICKKAIAADVKMGPVEIAKGNIKRFGFEKLIDERLGYGMEPLCENEADVIVIAGMGGILIKEIMEKSLIIARNAGSLILQPMNMAEVLRKWLNENGFEIVDEILAEETDKIYNILSVKWTGNVLPADDLNLYIGWDLARRKDDLFKRYAENKLKLLKSKITGMQKAVRQQEGLEELTEIMRRLEDIVKKL